MQLAMRHCEGGSWISAGIESCADALSLNEVRLWQLKGAVLRRSDDLDDAHGVDVFRPPRWFGVSQAQGGNARWMA